MATSEKAGLMLMRVLRAMASLVLGILLAAAASSASSQNALDTTLFGPKQYVRNASTPLLQTDTFSVPSAIATPFQLRIVNGEANGAKRISSAWIKVNGVQVAGPADFGQKVASIERTVELGPNNTLEVRLASGPDGFLTITVLGTRVLPAPTALTPNPLTIAAGASGNLTATLAPVPASPGALSVASANPAVASVPASVPFAAGQSQVAIPVAGVAQGNTTVSASANGLSATATVQVTPAPSTVTNLAPAALTITQGGGGALTVTISSAQPADTQVAVTSTNLAVLYAPSSITVPAGQVSAPVPVSAISPGSAQVIASLNGTNATSQVTVTPAPPTVVSLLPTVSTVMLGAGTTLTLTISSAQAADTAVAIAATPAGIVSAPSQVLLPAGQSTVAVPVATLALGQAGITASLNGTSASAVVNVVPPPLAVSALEPATFTMSVGTTSAFTVRINTAQTTNTEIALASSDAAVLQVPATVTIAQGATSAVFTATALATGDALITASVNATFKTAAVHVSPQPAAIVSLLPNPLSLQQGATGELTVTINVAQETASTIFLGNTSPLVLEVPQSVVLPAGALSVAIPVKGLAPGSGQVNASLNNTHATATVQVVPPPPIVTALTPATLSLPKGTPGVMRVTVSRAPNVATAVALASSNPSIASVPPEVNIPAGALYAEFPVASNAEGQATITASLNGGSATSSVSVAAAELVTLTLSPNPASAYIGESVPFSATGTMTDGTTQDFTTRVTWTSSNEAVATIASSGVASALAEGQTTITASFTFSAVQTGQPVTVTRQSVLTVKQPVGLVLSAPAQTLQIGQSTTVTVNSVDPAPEGGLVVSLTQSGSGVATFPASVTIPAFGTSATFTLTGAAAGDVLLTASAPNRLPGFILFTIQPQFAITSFSPASGPVGTAVTINGFGFDPVLANNTVRFNGELAVIVSGSATTINAIVPLKATTGPITLTNARGTASSASPFTVQEREAFDITLAPASAQVPPGGNGATKVALASTGLNVYPYAAAIAVTGLPVGVTVTLSRPTVYLGGDSIVTFSAASGAAAGTFPVTITATGQAGLTTLVRTKTLNLEVLAAGGTTITGRILHTEDDSPFVGARVRLGAAAVFTDATGTYRFVSPPLLGDQVLLIDGNTANTPEFEFPSGIAMPVMIVAGQDNKPLTSFIGKIDATKFTAITPGQAASVTDAEIPDFSLNIPSGAILYGWDGQPVTKVNVRKVPIDRLPIRPIPDGQTSKSVYLFYFFREGGANPTQPIPVSLPNDGDALPGEQVELWYYDESVTPDPNSNQWRLMGMGTVSADGKSIVSNPGVGIPKFCCGAVRPSYGSGGNTGGNGGNGSCPNTSNPVNLASGNALVFRPRPFGLSVLMPVNLNCQYRSTDPRVRLFGRGMSFTYEWFAEAAGSDAVRVTNPHGVRYMLSKESDGVFRARSGRSMAIEMEVTPSATGRTLKLADGVRYEFDTAGRLTAIVDLAGNRTTFQLDGGGFPSGMTDAAGKSYTFTRQGTNPPLFTRITDPAGRFVEFGYDASQRMTSYKDQGGGITLFEYDASNRIVKKTDPRSAIEQIEYDAAGRATRELLPEGGVQQFAYTVAGTTVTETRHTDENGNATTYRWNGLGFLTQTTDALGRVARLDLDSVNNLVKRRTDPAGRITQYTYNQRGDLIRTIDADGKQRLIEYDLRFRKPVRIENALGHVVTMEYNTQGKLSKLTSAENETTTFTYTAKGQLETVTDPLKRVSRFTYDSNGNLIEFTNPANETMTRTYDLANRLATVTDALNRTTQFTYDSLDRITEVRDAALGLTQYAYDANDNRISVTDPRNNPVERNVYDLRNRLIQRTDARNRNSTYVYDGVGNVIRMTDRKGQVTTYTYDAINRIASIADQDGRSTTYGYDLAGNVTRISDTQSGDILMSYDTLNRLTEIVSAQGAIQYAYDAIGRRTSRTLSGGDVTAYSYDKVNRLKSVTLRGKTASYGYDLAGRLAEKVLPNGIKVAYQYDAADRVTSIAYKKADDTAIETITYAYDAGGQRTRKALGGQSLRESAFSATYDEANRLASITLNGEAFTLGYDENGNLVSKSGPTSGTTTYTWDARNRLASIAAPSGAASFRYDAMGRRIEKTVNGNSTGFLYDGAQAIAELKGSALDTVYHTGLALDEVLARYAPSGNKTLLTDALQSVIAQANDIQSVDNFYAYSPYGEATTLGPDEGNPLQYTGRENDGTGLYYYRARYYDPVLKRFISEDPIGIAGGINPYTYVDDNPLTSGDPLGLQGAQPAIPSIIRPPSNPFSDPVRDQREQSDNMRRCLTGQCFGEPVPAVPNLSPLEPQCYWECPKNPNQCSIGDPDPSKSLRPSFLAPAPGCIYICAKPPFLTARPR